MIRTLISKIILPLLLSIGLLFGQVAGGATVVSAAGINFSDVGLSHPDRAHIGFWADFGLINGYPDGRFGPDDALTRAAATKIAAQVARLAASQSGPLPFKDVPASHW